MPIITLTSDWGTRDFYRAAVIGKIYSMLPNTIIVDISHNISPFSLSEAAFVVKNSAFSFPQGTIHMVCIQSNMQAKGSFRHIIAKYKGQYFIGEDNSVLSSIFDHNLPDEAYVINLPSDTNYHTFLARDLYAKVACHLAAGKPITDVAISIESINQAFNFMPSYSSNLIQGTTIYITHHGNAVTNISEELFNKLKQDNNILIRISSEKITAVHQSYFDVHDTGLFALFSSTGLMEIGIRGTNLSNLCHVHVGDPVSIQFYK